MTTLNAEITVDGVAYQVTAHVKEDIFRLLAPYKNTGAKEVAGPKPVAAGGSKEPQTKAEADVEIKSLEAQLKAKGADLKALKALKKTLPVE